MASHVLRRDMENTIWCKYFLKGTCAVPDCAFAHSFSEKKSKPDLTKTKMCAAHRKGKCSKEECKFAHSDKDLRYTMGVYKTQLCSRFELGCCQKENICRHAHGEAEVRVGRFLQPYKQVDGRCYYLV